MRKSKKQDLVGSPGSNADTDDERRSRTAPFLFALFGALLAGVAAIGASNWLIGLGGSSSGAAQSAGASNLTITAIASPAATNLLYPGSSGDVVVSISNPNPYPVTITAVQLPTDTTYASGYTSAGLGTPQAGCSPATPSGVTWSHATGVNGTSHTLTTALTVAANGQPDNPLTVTLTNAANMDVNAPAACEATFFSMPSFVGVAASGGAGTPTTSPAVDAWTS